MPKKVKKVLIIEDDKILSKAISKALSDAGFKSEVVVDGDKGIAKAKKIIPNLILLDLKERGEEVLKALKAEDRTNGVPVFILTAVDEPKSIADCLKMGAAGYFIKFQYSLQEIVKKVKEKL